MLRKIKAAKKWMLGTLVRRVSQLQHTSMLTQMTTMQQFHEYLEKVQPEMFFEYMKESEEKRQEFQDVMEKLNIDLKGKTFLDIGPGYGDALDVSHHCGADAVEFVEFDPFFFTYNRLKGFCKGYNLDHRRALDKLPTAKYDIIWCKGAISADLYIKMRRIYRLSGWLKQVERLASDGCHLIICPHWTNDQIKRNIDDTHDNSFTKTMGEHGFVVLEPILNHNHEPGYPITYYKSCG